jgi:hypothetical protein
VWPNCRNAGRNQNLVIIIDGSTRRAHAYVHNTGAAGMAMARKIAANVLKTCIKIGAVAYKFPKSVLILDVNLPKFK